MTDRKAVQRRVLDVKRFIKDWGLDEYCKMDKRLKNNPRPTSKLEFLRNRQKGIKNELPTRKAITSRIRVANSLLTMNGWQI